MKTLKTLEVWFVTGSQHLYGLDTKLGLIGIPPDSGTQIALTAGPSTTLPRISCGGWWLWQASCAFLYGKAHMLFSPVLRGRKSGYASVGDCDFLISLLCLWAESLEEHLPTSIAGVLRLRALNPSLCDGSARRFAQDDDFVVWSRTSLGVRKERKDRKSHRLSG